MLATKALIYISCLLAFSLESRASLYRCLDTDTEPVQSSEKPSSSISYETKSSTWLKNAKANKFHRKNKIPFLIYYAVDSSEPFMRLSVDYEIAQLSRKCQSSEYVNFVGLINSLYINKNEIIICKNKKLEKISLASFPSINSSLKQKREYIQTGDHSKSDDTEIMSYWVRYREITNNAFGKFPLAHPDFLYDLVNLVITTPSLFPTEKYMPFLNLKSHGSNHTVLSGLYNCQLKAKTKTQNEILKASLSKRETEALLSAGDFSLLNDFTAIEPILSKIALDSNAGRGLKPINELSLSGDYNLNGDFNLSSSIFGLGANEGLGTQQAFGVFHITLNAVLDDLFNQQKKSELGFLMLESCDTNRDTTFQKIEMKNILGSYSANASLWYRNLNWWEVLEKSKSSTIDLIEEIDKATRSIQNIRLLE